MPLRQPYEEPIGYCGGIPYLLRDGCPKELERFVKKERIRAEKRKVDQLRCELVNRERKDKGLASVSLTEYRNQYLGEDSDGNPLDDYVDEILDEADGVDRIVDYSTESDKRVFDRRIHYVSAVEVKASVPAGFEDIECLDWYRGCVVFAFDDFDADYEAWVGFPPGKLSALTGCKFFIDSSDVDDSEFGPSRYYVETALGKKCELAIGMGMLDDVIVNFADVDVIPATATKQSENCAYDIVKRMYLELFSAEPDDEDD